MPLFYLELRRRTDVNGARQRPAQGGTYRRTTSNTSSTTIYSIYFIKFRAVSSQSVSLVYQQER